MKFNLQKKILKIKLKFDTNCTSSRHLMGPAYVDVVVKCVILFGVATQWIHDNVGQLNSGLTGSI